MLDVQHTLESPQVCLFLHSWCFLKFIVSQEGIHLDSLKVQAIIELPPPQTKCQRQTLQGKSIFLCHFLPNYTTQAHGFFFLLCQAIPSKWDTYAYQSFVFLKCSLTQAPLIFPPNFMNNFILYVSASTYAIVKVIIQDNDDYSEHAIYYIINILEGPSINYIHDKKIPLVIVLSS